MSHLDNLLDELAEKQFGMTLTKARTDKVCINCKQPVRVTNEFDMEVPNPELFHSVNGVNEWHISGLCEKCFEEAFS